MSLQSVFKAVSLKQGRSWAVILTTKEGADHEIDGFESAAAARAWIEGEIGQTLCLVDTKAA